MNYIFMHLSLVFTGVFILRGLKMIQRKNDDTWCLKENFQDHNVISHHAFIKLLDENSVLIENAKGFMNYLLSFIQDKNFIITLTDKNANILRLEGCQEILDLSNRELSFAKGASVGKEHVGETAINNAIKYKLPNQVCGDDHVVVNHRNWSCYAAPIMKENELLGVLCLSEFNKVPNKNALGMVIASAKGIENQIKTQEKSLKIQEQAKYQSAIVENISEGFLMIDNQGNVLYINEKGGKILGIDRDTSIGRHIGTLVPYEPIILEVLTTGKGHTDREYVLENYKGEKYHLLKTAIPVRDEDGELIGVIDIFKEIQEVKKMVNTIVGAKASFTFDDIIGSSQKITECIDVAKTAADSASNTLILGESGTGKELFAQAIHNASERRKGPFIAINCAAIPKDLIESELFGYAHGAFTGGIKGGRPGKFELAHGGTIFLDEIGDMSLGVQAKLLRVLQDRKVVRVGGDNVFNVDVRIIAATNKDLKEACIANEFRWDIYYRLNVLSIDIPPLRDRLDDIPLITHHLIRKIGKRLGKETHGISDEALDLLTHNAWKGNVRELENTLERAINMSCGNQIEEKHLKKFISKENIRPRVIRSEFQQIMTLEEMEKQLIQRTLSHCEGNITQAAKLLNVSRNTLYNKIERYQFPMGVVR